jgi:hypothetical protein
MHALCVFILPGLFLWFIESDTIAAKRGGDKSVTIPVFKVCDAIYCQSEAEKTGSVNAFQNRQIIN